MKYLYMAKIWVYQQVCMSVYVSYLFETKSMKINVSAYVFQYVFS